MNRCNCKSISMSGHGFDSIKNLWGQKYCDTSPLKGTLFISMEYRERTTGISILVNFSKSWISNCQPIVRVATVWAGLINKTIIIT